MMLVWDTGALYWLTPLRSDFIDYIDCVIPVKDVTKVNRFIGIGTTCHKFIGKMVKIYYCRVSPITLPKQIYAFSISIPTIKCTVVNL